MIRPIRIPTRMRKEAALGAPPLFENAEEIA
jgi:hypothetical protein